MVKVTYTFQSNCTASKSDTAIPKAGNIGNFPIEKGTLKGRSNSGFLKRRTITARFPSQKQVKLQAKKLMLQILSCRIKEQHRRQSPEQWPLSTGFSAH